MGAEICCQKSQQKQTSRYIPPQKVKLNSQLSRNKKSKLPLFDQNSIDQVISQVISCQQKVYTKNDFTKFSRLGEGASGIVDLVQLKEHIAKGINIKYAMKIIPKKRLLQKRVVENLKLQKKVLAQLKNKFIVELKYSFQDKYNCYFVMEYASGGDVYSFLSNKNQNSKVQEFKKLGQAGAQFILACVILGLEGLHKHNIMYRDLKPENVLVFQNGYPKLSDFGLAKRNSGDQLTKTMAGTKIYFAPQILQRKGYNKSVDFWTLGVFLYELIIFEPPFQHRQIVKGKFIKICQNAEQNRDWKGSGISQQAKDLIHLFLKVDPTKRLGYNGFDDIKSHIFFKGFDWQKLGRQQLQSPLRAIIKKYPNKLKDIPPQQDWGSSSSYDSIQDLTYKEKSIKEL